MPPGHMMMANTRAGNKNVLFCTAEWHTFNTGDITFNGAWSHWSTLLTWMWFLFLQCSNQTLQLIAISAQKHTKLQPMYMCISYNLEILHNNTNGRLYS